MRAQVLVRVIRHGVSLRYDDQTEEMAQPTLLFQKTQVWVPVYLLLVSMETHIGAIHT